MLDDSFFTPATRTDYTIKEISMKAYHLNKDALTPMSVGVQKEWVLTNGIGGYAGRERIRHSLIFERMTKRSTGGCRLAIR